MLDINLPELNREETKKNVLKALKKYRLFLSSVDHRIIERVENGDIDGISEKDIKRAEFILDVRRGVNKLNLYDKQLIELAYLGREKHSWVKMCEKLNMTQPDYYRKRNKAFYELAYKLGIEVEEFHS
ncbi:ArpU family transcriptional regulator [Bacillus paranthracis]|uniref:transcriptional activator n=1 Tax=Bacillus phage phi4B1 TaxID=1643324 RepID=UPI000200F41E|nr:ArpU family transcriptional regulator [Bacillus paranthracis]YP_009206354.1 transcriptional activator [Bacillus phage phi4B1]ADY20350.1 group-specific protein [Bacillus thuringiensis serovar finitimus YBT-020]MRC72840.1 ArpU family transcriptional regulator [Bacillus thuringiensis]OTX71292.1 ArpU family transcriptional regulator [Bacillus thuringiensis serovar finitimus]ALF02587.1 ArpU family transcriptional regulator [Bacillus phage phi4B1]MCR6799373.1 ArpU family transcriptional regulato